MQTHPLGFIHRARARLLQTRGIEVEFGLADYFDVRELFAQLFNKLFGVADDDDRSVFRAETRAREFLYIARRNPLHILDVVIDLVQAQSIESERADLRDEARDGLKAAPEVSDQHCLARRQFRLRDGLARQSIQFGDEQGCDLWPVGFLVCVSAINGPRRGAPLRHYARRSSSHA